MANNRELSQFASFVEVGISSIGFTTSVGIGKTNPQFNLDVAGDINFTGTFYQGGTQFIASRWSATGSDIYRLSKVGINTSIVSSALTVNGDVSVSGLVTATSINVSGISTLGITSATNLTSQSLVVSGISTLGITSTTNLTSQSLVVSGISTFTNGPILVGTATSTGTASQPLQVTGGAYVSGNLGVGVTNPTAYKVQVAGDIKSSQALHFGTDGTYEAGTIYSDANWGAIIRANTTSPVVADFLFTNSADVHRFRIDTSGNVIIPGNTTATGTASQPLQVTGGAYVSGNVGIGTNNPSAKLDVEDNSASGYIAEFRQKNTSNSAQILIDSPTNGESRPVSMDMSRAGVLQWSIGQAYLDTNQSFHIATSTLQSGNTGSKLCITPSGSVGIGTASPQYTLHVVGSFAATTKSFVITHPTKQNYKLQHGSLEGPENGVYIRGRTTENIIELPEYWTELVDKNSITVNLTPIGDNRVWIEEINNNKVYIDSNSDIDCFYTVFAERKDVEKLIVEIEEN